MIIVICGSMSAAQEMVQVKERLEAQGHVVETPNNLEAYVNNQDAVESKWDKISDDLIQRHFEKIKTANAVLIVNVEKNGIPGYIGGNSLIELAFGHVLGKKKYLLNSIPQGLSYTDEIEAMQPVVLNGDISLIR